MSKHVKDEMGKFLLNTKFAWNQLVLSGVVYYSKVVKQAI